MGENMAGSGKRWIISLLAVLLTSGCAEDQVNSDIETKETTQTSLGSRSGAYYASEEDSHLEHLESNRQQHNEAYTGLGGTGSSYSYSEQQKAHENSQQHASQYQQVDQSRYNVPLVYGPGRGQSQYVLPGGSNYQVSNEEAFNKHYNYNRNQQANYNQAGYVVDNVITRLIPYNEYYWLHRQPGFENTISCRREGELHSYWTPSSECMICTCVKEWAYLEPVCVSCGLCSNPVPVTTANVLPIYIEPTTEIILPDIIPDRETCSPLPRGKPFQNPLHPCQICVCYEYLDVFGVPDVKIECQENPQCVLPPEPIPYIPDKPLPMPQCEKFPNNVVFPHPVEACKVCKCTVEVTPYGPQDQIICFPDSDCLSPVPIVIPEPVTTYPIIPEPIIVPVEPVWPPVGPATPRPSPGPLPGPSPHESCRPYQPNQPFQHPWDECQVCVCVEGYTVGKITIEINCYTKGMCCNEFPYEQTIAPLPYIPTPTPVYPYYRPGSQSWNTATKLQEQEQQNYKQYQQYGPQVPVQPYLPGYDNLISSKPGSVYVPGYGPKYYNQGQKPYLPVTYSQGAYGQNTAYDESEHYDTDLSYDKKAYQQGTYGVYGQSAYSPVTYNQGTKGQSTAYDKSEHYDKSLNYDQKAYAQMANGQGVLVAPGTYGPGVKYGQTAYGQSTAFDESEHYDKNLSYDQKAYAQSAKGQGVLYAPERYGPGVKYGQTAYGQSTAFDKSEHYDKSLNYDQKAYAQSAKEQEVLVAPGTYGPGVKYGQSAYGQSTAFDESKHYDKSLSYDQRAYAQSNNGQGGLVAPGIYGPGVKYGQSAYGQSTAFDGSEHYDKSLNYAQQDYSQGQAANYGVYGQSPVNKQILGLGPGKLSVKARTKSADPEINESSDERK